MHQLLYDFLWALAMSGLTIGLYYYFNPVKHKWSSFSKGSYMTKSNSNDLDDDWDEY